MFMNSGSLGKRMLIWVWQLFTFVPCLCTWSMITNIPFCFISSAQLAGEHFDKTNQQWNWGWIKISNIMKLNIHNCVLHGWDRMSIIQTNRRGESICYWILYILTQYLLKQKANQHGNIAKIKCNLYLRYKCF